MFYLFKCCLLLDDLHLRVENSNILQRTIFLVGLDAANAVDQIETGLVEDSPEDGVLAIEPGSGHEGDEELRAIGVLASVGHAQHARLSVVQHKVLILKVLTVDAERSPAITTGNITSLNHERGNYPVEDAVLVRLSLKTFFRR